MSLILVPNTTPGVTCRKLDLLGCYCTGTYEVTFDNVRVPVENIIGEVNKGFYSIMDTFQNERICIGGICAGESAKAIELTVDYVKTRRAFGGSLWDQQAVRPEGPRVPGVLAQGERAGGAELHLGLRHHQRDPAGFDRDLAGAGARH